MNGSVKPVRVLQICHDYHGPFQSVCRQYSAAFGEGQVTTVYLRGKKSSEVVKATGGDTVLFLEQPEGSLRGIKFSSIFQLAKLFRHDQFDVVIAHRYKAIYLAGIMSYFNPIKVLLGVVHEHKVFNRITRSLFVTFWRRNIHIIPVSGSVAKDVLKQCPSLQAEKRITTIANSIDESLVDDLLAKGEARQALNIPLDIYCYATVGRLVEKKNQRLLIKAYAKIASDDNCLLVVGAGPLEAALKSLAQKLEIGDKVLFLGHVPRVARYYRAFDSFVFTSDPREAFGIVLLEAMLAKVAIVCCDAPGPTEVVGDTALIFRGGDIESLRQQMLKVATMHKETNLQDRAFSRLMANYTRQEFINKLKALPALRSVGELE